MPALEDGMTADLRYTTASLPKSHPYAITSSGHTLYVGCVGNGADGVVVAINLITGVQTSIASGLQYIKQGMDVDGGGTVYWVTGPNNAAAGVATLYANAASVWTDAGLYGMCIDGDSVLYDYRPAETSLVRKRALTGATTWTQALTGVDAGLFGQVRGFDTTTTYVLFVNYDKGSLHVHNLSTGAAVHLASGSTATAPVSVAAISDTEAYVLCAGGEVYRYNPAANTLSSALSLGLPTAVGTAGYSSIHISRDGRQAYFVRGGWHADSSSIYNDDGAYGSDVGIYAIGRVVAGPTVGFIGSGTF